MLNTIRWRGRATMLLLALLLAAVSLPPAHAGVDDGPGARPDLAAGKSRHADFRALAETVPGALIVTAASPEAARRLEGAAWSRLVERVPALRGGAARALGGGSLLVEVDRGREQSAARALRALPGVLAVERDRVNRWAAEPNDPRFGEQWAHTQANTQAAWDASTGSMDIRVAVLDSGMFGSHEDLAENVVQQVDFSSGVLRVPPGTDNDPCRIGHGTAVGGVVGAVGGNGLGVTGVAWRVSMIDVALSSPHPASGCGGPRDSAVVAALHFVATHPDPVHVATMSFGAPGGACPLSMQQAIDRARSSGVTVVAASGNTGDDPLFAEAAQTPASCNGVISVGATGPSGTPAFYSTTNRWVDLAAPGGSTQEAGGLVLTTCHPHASGCSGGYGGVQGTSFSAPYVAGVAALIQSARVTHGMPRLGPSDVEAAFERSASGAAVHRDDERGWGLIDARGAIDLALAGSYGAPLGAADFPVAPDDQPAPLLLRLSSRTGATAAVEQAALVSRGLFSDGGASHAVIARADDYADALAGSSLGYGVAPLLFSAPTGPLAEPSRAELQRVLPRGGRVYLLGGTAALPSTLEGELQAMGYHPIRLSGQAREQTAAAVAREVRRLVGELEQAPPPPFAMVATRGNWPDAVAAGALGAVFGVPVLLTSRDALHSATRQALQEFRVTKVYVIGGTAAVSDATAVAAGQAARAQVVRLGGGSRTVTAVRVSEEIERLLEAGQTLPAAGIVVNLRRPDGFAHALSASVLAGGLLGPPGIGFGVFVPVEGNGGTILADDTRPYVCGLGADIVLQGDRDLVSQQVGEAIQGQAARHPQSC